MSNTQKKKKVQTWPTKVKILGIDFDIKYQDFPDYSLGKTRHWGMTCMDTAYIAIADDLHPTLKWHTLIHEIVETVMVLMNEKYDHDQFERILVVCLDTLAQNGLIDLPKGD